MSQLEVIVQESGLTGSKAAFILEQFQSYFALCAEWEMKARGIVVTSADQKEEMAQAREGRLFLREKRIAIETSRKKLKEDVLREGKAIDGIANVLKALIEPIEEHLDRQEHFVELEQKKIDDARRAEIEKRMKEEDEAKARALAEETERIRLENKRLREEMEEANRKAAEQRKKDAEEAAAAKAKADAVLSEEREKALKAERAADAEIERLEAAKRKAAADAKAKLDAEREAKERLEAQLKAQIECPKCGHKWNPVVA